ncbi:MAG: CotH kinase family protein, partial [Planctomycetes bacterium]|nr:CotH kinase family protein [Planctomycetota bacterium]
PLILDAEHTPIIPGPNDPVTVTARIIDELASGIMVTLHYRVDTSEYENGDEDIYPHHDPNDYNDVPMSDDGAHGDGEADDGLYGAEIPAQPDGTIIGFYVEARDAGTNTRAWPAPSLIDGVSEQVTNALYQVDESFDPDTWTAGTQPIYYLIMTENEKGRLLDIGDREGSEHNSDAQVNATFVSVDGVEIKVRHNVGVRNRGHGSRNDPPNNYRLNFPHDRSWEDATAINLNTKFTYLQMAGNALFRISGLAQCEATGVQARLNGENLAGSGAEMYGSYVHVEVVDTDFADNHYPDDDGGNTYKCMRVSHQADLRYEGTSPAPYRNNYFKRTNTAEDDWSDLMELCYVLDRSPDSKYAEEVRRVLNAEQWLRLLAINTLLNNNETTLANGNGDDYYLYRGLEDPRFVLIQHDLDSIFGMGDNQDPGGATRSIFRAIAIPTMKRFLHHPEFVPRYYWHLKNLIETTFSAGQLGPFLDELLGDFVPAGTIQQMKDFAAQRNAHVLSLIPSDLTIVSDLPQSSGYYVTDVNVAVLYGTADAIETRSVLVNGKPANWLPVDGEWDVVESQEANYETIVDRGSSWKYFDEYTDLGSDWYIDLNDSSWPEGDAELGYGDAAAGRPEATTIGYIDTNPGTPEVERNITTYFSRRFDVNDVSNYSRLGLRILRDDGAVVYLNGVEIARSNMPQGEIGYNTPSSTNVYGNDADGRDMETLYYGGGTYANDDDFTNIDIGLLQVGTNMLAVEIHQCQPSSSDISFDLDLRGQLKDAGPPIGVSLNPGINRIIVKTFDGPDGTGSKLDSGYIDVWYDDGDVTGISGTLAVDTILDAASGPWHVTGGIVVPSGITLTIEPGTTLFFNTGAGITVQNGGRLVAEGTEYRRIRLTSVPGGSHWEGVKFDHTLEDNRLAYIDHDSGDTQTHGSTDVRYSRVTIDNMTWSGTDTQVLNIDHPSVICRNSVFPSITSTEPLHGVGLTGEEYLIFEGCVFGTAEGYNDTIDFRDAQRPGPVVQFYDNIFLGGGDDGADLDSADAHIEGNVFMNFHGGGGDGTSSAVATGVEGGDPTEVYVARNIFINNDQAVLLKEDCFLYAQNNVFVGSDVAVVSFGEPYRDPPRTPGKGAFMEGNIFWNNAAMFEHFFQEPLPTYGPTGEVIVDNSILPVEWH